jgi:hypothetical protein
MMGLGGKTFTAVPMTSCGEGPTLSSLQPLFGTQGCFAWRGVFSLLPGGDYPSHSTVAQCSALTVAGLDEHAVVLIKLLFRQPVMLSCDRKLSVLFSQVVSTVVPQWLCCDTVLCLQQGWRWALQRHHVALPKGRKLL